MKFTYLALLGLASAAEWEEEAEEETELMGQRIRWERIPRIMQQEFRIMETLGELEPEAEEAMRRAVPEIKRRVMPYVPELMAWGHSKTVRAKQANDRAMMKSLNGRNLERSVRRFGFDLERTHWA